MLPTLYRGRAHCAVDCIGGSAQPHDQVRHIKQMCHPEIQHARTAHEVQMCTLRIYIQLHSITPYICTLISKLLIICLSTHYNY